MNIDDLKVYGGFIASTIVSVSNVETILKLIVLGLTAVFTTFRIIDIYEKRKERRKNGKS